MRPQHLAWSVRVKSEILWPEDQEKQKLRQDSDFVLQLQTSTAPHLEAALFPGRGQGALLEAASQPTDSATHCLFKDMSPRGTRYMSRSA